tara:strand:+ start:92 stop:319 length:228 start_codon:yes stop_codon:yes gene_type:complete
MSKRIIKLASDKIRPILNSLLEMKINVVLHNGLTFYGKLSTISVDGITIKDPRAHDHFFKDHEIFEIIYDRIEPL